MKKLYLLACWTIVFIACSFRSWSQPFTGGVYSTIANGNLSVGGNWDVHGIPPFGCDNCQININHVNTLDIAHWMVQNNSQINVAPNAIASINGFLELFNSTINVYNPDTLYINDEVHLYGTSNINLGNTGVTINTTNPIGNPSHGTIDPGDNAGSGIYFIVSGGNPVTAATVYDVVLNQSGYGGQWTPLWIPQPSNWQTSPYTFNCGGTCIDGFVNGPANIQHLGMPAPHGAVIVWQFAPILPLPITLTEFIAVLNNDKTVQVNWATSEEINSDYFGVERSADGAKWQAIGNVKAKGSSSITVNYSFNDKTPLSSLNYYRLKMVDLDSKFHYSRVATIQIDGKPASLVVYNNPFTDQIRFKVNLGASDILDIRITDMFGSTYAHRSVNAQSGDNYINLAPTGLSRGMYILNIKGRSYNQVVKLVKE